MGNRYQAFMMVNYYPLTRISTQYIRNTNRTCHRTRFLVFKIEVITGKSQIAPHIDSDKTRIPRQRPTRLRLCLIFLVKFTSGLFAYNELWCEDVPDSAIVSEHTFKTVNIT